MSLLNKIGGSRLGRTIIYPILILVSVSSFSRPLYAGEKDKKPGEKMEEGIDKLGDAFGLFGDAAGDIAKGFYGWSKKQARTTGRKGLEVVEKGAEAVRKGAKELREEYFEDNKSSTLRRYVTTRYNPKVNSDSTKTN